MMTPSSPIPIYRIIHIDNLDVCLRRCGLYAPNSTPDDGLHYRTIHNMEIQKQRQICRLNCGPCGVVHDYVPFYFGCLSPMLFQLKTGRVEGYDEGQEPIIYLASTIQVVYNAGVDFIFSDGHGIAAFTEWYDDLINLDKVDWDMVHQRYWRDDDNDNDRQRRKQAEFLVHRFFDWNLICEIGVINVKMQKKVEIIMKLFPANLHKPVNVNKNWYY